MAHKGTRRTATQHRAPTRVVFLDMHAMLHRAYHALPAFTSPQGEPTGALFGFTAMLAALLREVRPTHLVACYDLPGGTHRHHAYADYKAGRRALDDALAHQITRSRDLLAALGVPVYAVPGFEADDLIATLVAHARKELPRAELIIASGDLDTLQLVRGKRVRVFTLKRGVRDTVWYDEQAVRDRFGVPPRAIPDFKGLAGDASDNIPGVPGVGEKTARALLGAYGSLTNLLRALHREGPETVAQRAGVGVRPARLVLEHEEEAQFSRELAMVRTDAPVRFAPAAAAFPHAIDRNTLEELMRQWGFRTVAARLMDALEQVGATPKPNNPPTTQSAAEEALRYRARLALWLTNPDHTSPSWEEVVAATGASSAHAALATLEHTLDSLSLRRVYEEVEVPLTPVLRRMEEVGIPVNTAILAAAAGDLGARAAHEEARAHELAGVSFNLRSPQQLAEVLYDRLGIGRGDRAKRTPTGRRSTREEVLMAYREDHPIIEHVLRYRTLTKLISTYLEPLQALRGPDGRVHPTFLQMGTATGRLASQHPNVQNLPTTEEGLIIRRAIEAPEGRIFLALDYSQIELRIAAILSQEEKLIEAFRAGKDIHRTVAAEVFGVAAEQVTPDQRRRAKAINFGILYGMGITALAATAGMNRAEAAAFHEQYFATFPGIARYVEATKHFARTHGYTQTLWGRKRWFPGLQSPLPYVVAQAERMAINAPIQGTQADLIKRAMVLVAHDILTTEHDAHLILQVHDELVFEVATSALERVARAARTLMEEVLDERVRLGVPLTVTVRAGKTLADLTPLHV